jgi:hypothetical protein
MTRLGVAGIATLIVSLCTPSAQAGAASGPWGLLDLFSTSVLQIYQSLIGSVAPNAGEMGSNFSEGEMGSNLTSGTSGATSPSTACDGEMGSN